LDWAAFNITQDKQDIKGLIDCWAHQSCEDSNNLEFHTLECFLLQALTKG